MKDVERFPSEPEQPDRPEPALSSAWRGVTPPPLPDDARDCDERTRAAVDWLRRAYARTEPRRAAPRPSAGVLALPPSTTRRWAGWLAAAAVLVALSGLALRGGRGPRAVGDVADAPAGNPPFEMGEVDDPLRIASLSEDQLELRSGSVRLILVSDGAAARDASDTTAEEAEAR